MFNAHQKSGECADTLYELSRASVAPSVRRIVIEGYLREAFLAGCQPTDQEKRDALRNVLWGTELPQTTDAEGWADFILQMTRKAGFALIKTV